MKKVFIVDLQRPWKPIREVECEIVDGKKFVWADDGHRHLLGGSAFFLRKGAERRKLYSLNQITLSGYIAFHAPLKRHYAAEALRKHHMDGGVL